MSISAPDSVHSEEARLRAADPVPRVVLTPAGEQVMRAELERLQQRLDGEFVERLREARELGGYQDDEYLQIKEEEAVLAARVRRLEDLLESAEVVDVDAGADGIVAVGSQVEVRNARTGAVRRHRITGGFEQAEPGDVSASSPVGAALLGRRQGDVVEVELPNGRTVRLEVVSVGPAEATAQPSRA